MSVDEQLSAFQRKFGAVKGRARFQGLGAAALLVGMTGLAAALAVPRATKPDLVPLPLPERRVLARVKAKTDALAREARGAGLSYDVRAVGEAIRRAGAENVAGQGVPEAVLGDVRMFVRRARERGSEPGLRALLALQTELFVHATQAFEASGRESLDLRELGGDFLTVARENGWLDGPRLRLGDEERAALFRIRWTELTGLRREPAFAPSLDEYRVYYAFHLRRRMNGAANERAYFPRAFSVLRALEKRDPSYPASFARGVLLYQNGNRAQAADAFRAHLAQNPNGPWTLRAKNHLLDCLGVGEGG